MEKICWTFDSTSTNWITHRLWWRAQGAITRGSAFGVHLLVVRKQVRTFFTHIQKVWDRNQF